MPPKYNSNRSHSAYVEKRKEEMTEPYKLAAKHSKMKDLDCKNDSGRCSCALLPGNLVCIRNLSKCDGTGKSACYIDILR